jgi:sugar lactone lactonase YvrE
MPELDQTIADRGPPTRPGLEGRLWELWRQGQRPNVQEFLAGAGSLPAEKLAAVLAVDQQERWQRGERVRAEAYLQKYPALRADRERALELVFGEFLLREEHGETPTLEEFQRRFPQYASRLQEQVALHRAVRDATSPSPGGPAERQLPGFTRSVESQPGTRPSGAPAVKGPCNFLAAPQQLGELGRLGRYRVLRLQGSGGMGMVFRAEDTLLRRPVALKVLLPALAAHVSVRQRFLREARALAAIDHPHIIAIHDLGEERGMPFLAMPLLLGESLDKRLKRPPPLSLAEAVRIGREIAEGLAAAHTRGLMHRDIKPANIWLEGGQGQVKILDFGLARAIDEVAHLTCLTQTGEILGTPAYLAPEQAAGDRVDHRCDLFSLGCVLYQACTGELPFKGNNMLGLRMAVATQDPRSPEELNPLVPPALSDLVLRLLAKRREQRPASAAEVAEALRTIAGELTRSNKPSLARVHARLPGGARLPAIPFSRRWFLAGAGLVAGGMLLPGVLEAIRRLLKTRSQEILGLRGHTSLVLSVCFSPDGQRLASGSWDKTVKVWDLANAQDAPSLRGHTSYVASVSFDPDGQYLASASGDGTVKVWGVPTGQEVVTLHGHTGPVNSVCFSPDGQCLASASSDKTVGVWDADSGQNVLTLKGHADSVYCVCFSPDGRRLASASYDRTVMVWDAQTGQLVLTLQGHLGPVRSVGFSPDGQHLASASDDKTVTVWDAQTGQPVLTLQGHAGPVRSVCFSPDGRRLASASFDKTVKVWNAQTGQEIQTLQGHTGSVYSVCFSLDGQRLASGSDDKTVKVWNAASDQ